MQNQNNKKKYLIVAVIILLILAVVWLIMANTQKAEEVNIPEQETSYGISANGVFKYQDNILEWNSNSVELESDIVDALPLDNGMLVHTIANEEYPQGQYAIYQDKTKVADLPKNTNSARRIGDKVFYVVTEDSGSVVYSQSNQKITSIPHKYANITPAGNDFILSYTTETDKVGHIYYSKITNTQSKVSIPEGFAVVCSSGDLKYLLLAPVNGPNESYQLYLTQKEEAVPVGNGLKYDSIKWVEGKGFISIWEDLYSPRNGKLILISTTGEQKTLYESDKVLDDTVVVENKIFMVTSDGKQLQAEI